MDEEKKGLKILGLALKTIGFISLLVGYKALKENDRILLKVLPMGYRPLKMKNNKMLMVRGSHRHNKNNSSIHLICQLCSLTQTYSLIILLI